MRLVVLGPGHPFRGGIARTTTELVAALVRRGHEVLFLTPRRQYPRWAFPGASDRDPEACPRLACAEATLDPLDPRRWLAARRRAAGFAAAAWVIPYWTWVWAPAWRTLLARGRPPVVAVVHNPEDHDAGAGQRLAARWVLRRVEGLFTHARALAGALERRYPGTPVGWHLLPPPRPRPGPGRAAARERLGLPGDVPVALFLGIVRPYKGVDILLDAAAQLPPRWRVVVAGEPWGGLGERLARRAAAPDLAGRVHLRLGWVPEAEVPVLLDAADVVVLPYRAGSQSAVAPMALAHGVPVITTAVGGLPELVEDGRSGVVVPAGDPAALAGALAALDRERLAALAEGARRRAAALTWDAYAAALEEVVRAARVRTVPPAAG